MPSVKTVDPDLQNVFSLQILARDSITPEIFGKSEEYYMKDFDGRIGFWIEICSSNQFKIWTEQSCKELAIHEMPEHVLITCKSSDALREVWASFLEHN
jgi:hypothetical protein